MIALTVPIVDIPNSNQRGHWTSTARKRALMRWAVGELARDHRAVTCPAALTLTFIWPDKRRRDLDNFEAKGWIDGMVDGGVLPDDDGIHLPRVTREVGMGRGLKGTVTIVASLETINGRGGE